MIPFTQRTARPSLRVGTRPIWRPHINGTPYNCVFLFSADGQSLVQQTGARVSTGTIGAFIGGNGPTGREGQYVIVLPLLERYNFNLLAHYTFSPAPSSCSSRPSTSRVDTLGQNSGPVLRPGQHVRTGDFASAPGSTIRS